METKYTQNYCPINVINRGLRSFARSTTVNSVAFENDWSNLKKCIANGCSHADVFSGSFSLISSMGQERCPKGNRPNFNEQPLNATKVVV